MSDRKRRWICRLLFLVACVVPTIWSVVRVRYQPTAEQWSTELLVSLGLPFSVTEMETPDATTIRLKELIWKHPELGQLAKINQLTISQQAVNDLEPKKWRQVHVLPGQNWHIDQLEVRESALEEILSCLNQNWLRRQLGGELPEIKIDQLNLIRTQDDGVLAVMKLSDVTIRSQLVQHETVLADLPAKPWALTVLGSVQPLDPPTIMGGKEWTGESVPFAFRSQRSSNGNFFTDWLLSLDKPLPLRYVKLEQVPRVLQRGNLAVKGNCSGRSYSDQWYCRLHEAQLTSLEERDRKLHLEDLAEWFGVAEGRGQIRGMAQLQIELCTLRCLQNSAPELVELDARLTATNGGINGELLQRLRLAYQTRDDVAITAFSAFDHLNVRLFVQNGGLYLLPIDSTDPSSALIRQTDQVLLTATGVPFFLANLNDWLMPNQQSDPWNCLVRLVPRTAPGITTGMSQSPVQQADFQTPVANQ